MSGSSLAHVCCIPDSTKPLAAEHKAKLLLLLLAHQLHFWTATCCFKPFVTKLAQLKTATGRPIYLS
jgi:hypothetical protein